MQKKDTADWHLVCGSSGHMDYYRKIFLKIDYDFRADEKLFIDKIFRCDIIALV